MPRRSSWLPRWPVVEEVITPAEDMVFSRGAYGDLRVESEEGVTYTRLNGTWDVWNTWLNNGTAATNTTVIWQTWVTTAGTGDFTQAYIPQRTYAFRNTDEGPQVASRYDPVRPDPVERNAPDREDRARALLISLLTKRQRESYEAHGWFEVRGSDKGHYRLGRGITPGRYEGGRLVERLCIHPSYGYPTGDEVAAQKLLVETDEATFRRIANITRQGAYA